MRDQSEDRFNNCREEEKKNGNGNEFAFCEVCRLNHNQGRGHKYFPNHVKSLSPFLSRFQSKLSDVRFFLKNPSPLRAEHASRNRLWCVFCDFDVDEVGSSFACSNAISHLASEDHLKNLKSFLWKNGGGMDQVDSFRISEVDLAKWEKKCRSLKSETAGEGSHRPLIGPLKDIHNEMNSECIDSLDKNSYSFSSSSFSKHVMPLQTYTNERYQVSNSEPHKVSDNHRATLYFPVATRSDTNSWDSKDLTGYMDGQQSFICNGDKFSRNGYISEGGARPDERMLNDGGSSQGLQNLTQISSIVQEAKGNVHSGAPPPWFDASEEDTLSTRIKPELRSSNLASLNKPGKSQKLNPKRVGAAWAERRKVEMEMEKRGETVANNFDSNWLPNFGRVWQYGTRKESRKEFEVENKNSPKATSQSETLINIQPYVSKRMRTDASK
ncbi:TITAN-like protein isoform X2 [Diospyros lotus]|uniref:TITAN-like protein isoform X2 n=1 Tax=Diospyros lotus TaxID=55363 RepID=UPI00224CBA4B|nr:TITAN-like protein isoform X2 [Diospyros lotus]